MTPVARGILIACVAVFLLQQVAVTPLEIRYALWPLDTGPGFPGFHLWQLVSYGFLHGGFQHLFFNMFALYMFAPDIERLTGPNRFLVYYLVCVVSAAVAQLAVLKLMGSPPVPTVGASGGVFGVLLAFGLAYPHRKLMLIFPPIPMPAWLFVTLYGLLELVLGITTTGSGVAHWAHLGGMVGGFALILYWRHERRGPRSLP
jgi:membrane associated rhomboid family serine protease